MLLSAGREQKILFQFMTIVHACFISAQLNQHKCWASANGPRFHLKPPPLYRKNKKQITTRFVLPAPWSIYYIFFYMTWWNCIYCYAKNRKDNLRASCVRGNWWLINMEKYIEKASPIPVTLVTANRHCLPISCGC